ncbi:MAG: vWA domain-containing protein [Polyangiales bacterium]
MRLRPIALLLVLFFVVACSASSGGGGRRGGGDDDDAGSGGGGDAGTSMTGDDGGSSGTDSGPRPDAPMYPDPDAGCETTEPVGTTIIGDPPDMLLTVDISGSMCSPLLDMIGSMTTKLKIMKDALDMLVMSKEARINFGLMLFPDDNMCAPGTVRNEIAPRNAGPIMSTLSSLNTGFFGCPTSHGGATPTHTSLQAALDYYETIPVNEIGRYVLLATDGLPNCGPELPDGGTEETVDETVAAIEALADVDIQTYVLGFGADITGDPDALDRMATAGGTGMPYSATSAAELDAALDSIAAEVIPPSCTVELDGPERDPRLFQVSFDGGELIPRDESHSSGWDYDPETNTITFYGEHCDMVEAGDVDSIDVDFGCPGPLI